MGRLLALERLENAGTLLGPAPLLRVPAEPLDEAAHRWFDPSVAVPFAINESGAWVLAAHLPDPTRNHVCPFCTGSVRLRQSERAIRVGGELVGRSKIRPHWMHRGKTCFEATSDLRHGRKSQRSHKSETRLHKRIKRLIAREIEAWKEGTLPSPRLEHSCSDRRCTQSIKSVSLGEHVVTAVEEHVLSSRHVVDVALLDAAGDVVLGIEVYVTHEVNDEKRAALDIPWIEIDAANYQPGEWRVRQSSEAAELCQKCRARIEAGLVWWHERRAEPDLVRFVEEETVQRLANLAQSQELTEADQRRVQAQVMREYEIQQPMDVASRRILDVASERGLPVPGGYAPHRWYCHACLQPMLVFSWAGRRDERPPPQPRPQGLRCDQERGWVHNCPGCGWPQDIRWRRAEAVR